MSKKTVALRLSRLSVAKKTARTRFIVASMEDNPHFPAPNPALSVITANADALDAARVTAMGGGPDDTAFMHSKELLLDFSLKSLAAYVEWIANQDPNSAEAIIRSAGMEMKVQVPYQAHEFQVRNTPHSGEVKLSTRYVANATFIWHISHDPSAEQNWKEITCTRQSKLIHSGLESGVRYYFRVAVLDRFGMNPWSNVLNVICW
ncbi:MAG TPA: fibronectin type III domain-containing protein [Bacteroidia bacterium]|jgi:hypothetical protein